MTDAHSAVHPHASGDIFLEGNFAPVHEEVDVRGLPVEGELPPDLEGIYMRNGPNPAFDPIAYKYPFDGDGMIHAVYFEKGKARYRNRFVETKGLTVERRAGRALYGSLMKPVMPDPKLIEGGDQSPAKNVANTHVVQHGGHILALYEGGLPYELSPELETRGEFDYDGKLVGAMTAHPHLDPGSGELHFFRYDVMPPFLTYFVAGPDGKITRSVDIDVDVSSMMHDFAVTENHVVFFQTPAILDLQAAMRGEPVLQWQPERGTRIGIVERGSDKPEVKWVDTDPFFVFHFMNAFERNGSIEIDYVWRNTVFVEGKAPSTLHRISIDPGNGRVSDSQSDEHDIEFPRVDERVTGRDYRLGYTIYTDRTLDYPLPGARQPDGIVQYDVRAGTSKVQTFGEGRYPGEPSFVPKPGSASEDDGYVVTFVHDAERDQSDLVIVEVESFGGDAPVAAIQLPVRVPQGLHGSWMSL